MHSKFWEKRTGVPELPHRITKKKKGTLNLFAQNLSGYENTGEESRGPKEEGENKGGGGRSIKQDKEKKRKPNLDRKKERFKNCRNRKFFRKKKKRLVFAKCQKGSVQKRKKKNER